MDAQKALETAAAITMQRVYRGRCDRKYVEQKKIELADFIQNLRLKESEEMEELYYETHTIARWKKNFKETKISLKKAWIKRKAKMGKVYDAEKALEVDELD